MTAYTRPDSCRVCPYYERTYVPPVIDEVSLGASIALIGEAPGRDELEQGAYFVGLSGEVLDVMLQEAKIPRDDIALLNVVRCDPGGYSNVNYDPIAVEMCSKLLWQDLEAIHPRVIVPMGNLALKAVLGKQGITKARGHVTTLESGMAVVPTFHPAYVLRSPAYAELVVSDLGIVHKVSLDEPVGSQKKTDYRFFQTPQEVYTFFEEAHAKGAYSLDSETTSLDYRQAEVICLSLSHTPYQARVLPFFLLPNLEVGVKTEKSEEQVTVVKLQCKIPQFWDETFLIGLYSHLMDNKATKVYMQNGKYDLRILNEFFRKTLGLKVYPHKMRWYDTQNMGALLNENVPHNLKDMSRLHTDIVYEQDELALVSKGQITKMTMRQLLSYAGQDADATLRLGIKFEKELRSLGMWLLMEGEAWADMPVLKALYQMELFGAPLSKRHLERMKVQITDKLSSLYGAMATSTGEDFNPNSHPQVRRLLFDVLELPPVSIRTPKGEMSTDKHAIDELLLVASDYPGIDFVRSLKLHRQYSTVLHTFIEGAEKRSSSRFRLHPDFLSARTVSGRVVCVNPNIANIPKSREFEEGILVSVRGLYVARKDWYILYGDWAQQEFKVAALVSGDTRLIRELFDEGADFHTLTADALFPEFRSLKRKALEIEAWLAEGEGNRLTRTQQQQRLESLELQLKNLRTDAKVYNFGQLYGGGDEGLAVLMGISVAAVEELTRRRSEAYPELARFIEHTPSLALAEGVLEMPFGRKRRFPFSPDRRVRSEQGRQGINFIPQSSASYIGRGSLVRICRRLRWEKLRGFPFNVVYDSILAEVPKEEVYHVARIMTEEMTRPVKELDNRVFSIDFGLGKNWAESEKNAVKVASALTSREEVDRVLPYVRELVSRK